MDGNIHCQEVHVKKEERTKHRTGKDSPSSGLRATDPQNRSSVVLPLKTFAGNSINADKSIKDTSLKVSAKCDSHNSHTQSIRQEAFSWFEKNPLLTAKPLSKIMGLDYSQYGDYLRRLKQQWKWDYQNEQGSNCSNPDVHAWRGFCYLPDGLVDRKAALEHEWSESRSRNRFLLWKDARLGRMQWFETNRVNLYVRKPANLGKASQLFCLGFYANGLISDIKILEPILRTLRFKSAHFVFKTNQRLPRMNISLFQESNGIFIKLGDRSHPNSAEVILSYMNWAERWERLAEKQLETLEGLGSSKTLRPRQDKSFGVI
jgi:hypothetical protein